MQTNYNNRYNVFGSARYIGSQTPLCRSLENGVLTKYIGILNMMGRAQPREHQAELRYYMDDLQPTSLERTKRAPIQPRLHIVRTSKRVLKKIFRFH
jgi:hypothetical protein